MNTIVKFFCILWLLTLSGCKKNEAVLVPAPNPEIENSFLTVSDTLISASPYSGSHAITISSDTEWKIENNSRWLQCNATHGKGNGAFIISWAGSSASTRVDSVIIKAGRIRVPVLVNQSSVFLFVGTTFNLGNSQKTDLKDELFLHFNKPIKTINYLRKTDNMCVPGPGNVSIERVNSNKSIRMITGCVFLGQSIEYEYSVTDEANNELTGKALFNIFSREIKFTGRVKHYLITTDNKYAWIVTSSPNQVHCISLADSSFKRSYDLNFDPIKIVYNYFNNRLYILADPNDYSRSKYISVMNPETGQVEKRIELKPDQYEHPQDRNVYPRDLAFGSNGYGIILSLVYESSAQRWKVIDSRADDKISIHPAWSWTNTYQSSFASVQPNFDGSKLVLQYNWGDTRIGLLDCQSTEIQEITPTSGYNLFIKPSKTNNDIYCGHVFNQFIRYANGTESVESGQDARSGTSVEFNYKNNGQGIIYWINLDGFQILNYNNQQIVYSHSTASDLLHLSGTSDGKFLLTNREHGLYFFETDLFRY